MTDPSLSKRAIEPNHKPTRRLWLFRSFLLLVLFLISALGWYSLGLQDSQAIPSTSLPSSSLVADNITVSPTNDLSQTSEGSATKIPVDSLTTPEGSLIVTIREGGNSHLWVYVAGEAKPVPLTWGPWDDRDPAIDPSGERLAFSSNRAGAWDLYLLELSSGDIRQLTTTPGYEGQPTWSPDGMWIAFEAYYDGDFDIRIVPIEGNQAPVQLTNHPASDTQPDWDPAGRRIAFVSDRDGSPDIYIANLDRPDDRFFNLTQSRSSPEAFPSFSPDGTWLAYSQLENGVQEVLIRSLADLERPAIALGLGEHPVWSPDGKSLAAIVKAPQRSHLVSYAVEGSLPSTGFPITQSIYNLAWTQHGLQAGAVARSTDWITPTPLFEVDLSQSTGQARTTLVGLSEVAAPNPVLSDAVNEAFEALRRWVSRELGWDFLDTLEHAFLGINDPLPPGLSYDDWLYTGRAFAFNRDAVEAGYVEIVREDIGGYVYWRVFVRAALQDGSQGEPLRQYPWDFSTRFGGDPQAYDQGGSLMDHLPQGYYLDFTQLSQDHGFERVPALANWRTYYPGTRFNEFVYRQNLEWLEAMLELYPLSAIVTPTPFLTPTPTPTRTLRPTPTPWWWRWETPTPSATPFIAPTATP